MEEQLITFETAKSAKEKGFNLKCRHRVSFIWQDNPTHYLGNYLDTNSENVDGMYSAPTQSLLQKWLREVHNIFVEVNTDCTSAPKFSFDIKQFVGNPNNLSEKVWDWVFPVQNENWGLDRTYETSLEAGLQEGLKLINEKLN